MKVNINLLMKVDIKLAMKVDMLLNKEEIYCVYIYIYICQSYMFF